MNTITLTEEQMKALQSGQSITIEPPKPIITKWDPKGGRYTIYGDFRVEYSGINAETFRLAGTEYQTQTQAEQAAKALRSYARQLAWLAENDDGWTVDWNNTIKPKPFVYFDTINNKYNTAIVYQEKCLSRVYMSQDNAEKLCKLLNDGIVEF
jgi:hypothetical protein